ncbi:deoxyribonuclease TATDN1-like [Macrosteles quadrilineatus]|uniref:deoxyribonuclease TATDN1-like n=1 Tax=Macrosteles quadrilineatus TaxID=74068 RepID=UPI0023E25091|nr:deoxyribonuclease TATDN1-like [Macrosteles quadrilineatus]
MEYKVTGLTDTSASLWDDEFNGISNGEVVGKTDIRYVLSRAWDSGLEKIFITGKDFKSSKRSLEIAKTDRRLYCTVGCHPSQYPTWTKKRKKYPDRIAELIDHCKKKCVAVGNFGLDYTDEGLERCIKKDQLEIFDWHVQFGHFLRKPMQFHFQGDAFDDMMNLLSNSRDRGALKGVCHSFQGSPAQARELTRKGFYIGFDGCSLKEKQHLEVAKSVPLNRLLLGTSSPRCSVQRPHAGMKLLTTGFFSKSNRLSQDMVVGRTEPSHMCHLLEIVARARSMELQELADIIQMNVKKLFFKKTYQKSCECERVH